MLTHIQLAAWVAKAVKAVMVAMALSSTGCWNLDNVRGPAPSPLASVKWDGPEVLPDSSSKPTDAAQTPCPCGPDCKCREGWNDACKCPDCKCDPKGEKPSAVNDGAKAAAIEPGFVPVPDPIGEGTEGPGGFTGLLCIMDNGPCLHCVTQTATVASMPAWKDRIRIVHDGEQQAYGIGEVYGFPCWVAFIEGRAVRMHTGALSANEIADFNGNQPFGTAESEANRKSTARGWVWDGRESRWVWQMQRLQTPTMRNSYCPSCQ